jgi:hypothetical protein
MYLMSSTYCIESVFRFLEHLLYSTSIAPYALIFWVLCHTGIVIYAVGVIKDPKHSACISRQFSRTLP